MIFWFVSKGGCKRELFFITTKDSAFVLKDYSFVEYIVVYDSLIFLLLLKMFIIKFISLLYRKF